MKSAPRTPHVLLVMCDQMNPLRTPVYGDPVCRMPHLQRLAGEGVVFANAYCNSPLCVPSRASMMTGRLISDIQCGYDNGSVLNSELPTFCHMLESAGYQTVLSGKMHFIGPDQLHGFRDRLTPDIYPEDLLCTPAGFGADPQSHVEYGANLYRETGVSNWDYRVRYDEETHFQALKRLRELGEGRHGSEPFLLTVSYTNPHSPFTCPQEFYDLYADAEFELPELPDDIPGALDPYNAYLAKCFGFHPADEATRRQMLRSYYGQCSYIDHKLGELLKVLNEENLADDTIVVFMSDHGEMMGTKGMYEKRTFLEESLRVPLVVWAPNRFNACRVNSPVSLVDLFPTLIDWAQADWDQPGLVGTSWNSLLEHGESSTEGRWIISEYFGESVCYPFRCMVSPDRWKYVHFPDAPEQDLVFKLWEDPDETKPVSLKACSWTGLAEARRRLNSDYDHASFRRRIDQSLQDRHLVLKSIKSPGDRPWRFYPPVSDLMQH